MTASSQYLTIFRIGAFSTNNEEYSPISMIEKFFTATSNKNVSYIKENHVEFKYTLTALNKELHTNVVQQNRANHCKGVLYQLWSLRGLSRPKCDVAIKPESGKECNREDNAQRCNMRRNYHETEMDELLANNVVVDDVVPNGIEQCRCCTTRQITKNLR